MIHRDVNPAEDANVHADGNADADLRMAECNLAFFVFISVLILMQGRVWDQRQGKHDIHLPLHCTNLPSTQAQLH